MRFLVLPLILVPSLAWSQSACPTGADLAGGIQFELDGEATETYKTINEGVVSVEYKASDGYQSRILLGKGIYLLEFAEIVDGNIDTSSRTTYSHELKPVNMPDPTPMGRWVSKAAVLDAGSPYSEIQNHSFGPMTTLTIGSCSYDMIPISVHYDDEDRTIDLLEYMPDLGLAILSGSSSLDENGTRVDDVYSYFSIRAAGPAAGSGGKKGKKGG